MAYLEYWNEVKGQVPGLDLFLAQRFVNRAWRDIRESRHWSFLRAEGVLWSPAEVNSGTVTVTQFSASVTLDATATTALTGLSNPLITFRQFRVGTGSLYNISSLAGSTLTLDRLYREDSGAGKSYSVYRCYYGPPEDGAGAEVTDFLCYKSVTNPIDAYALRLDITREELDKRDPQRASLGSDPLYLVPYRGNPSAGGQSNQPQYEMWPHPTAKMPYICSYMKRGVDFSASTDALPPQIPEGLLIERALYYGADWAMKNVGKIPELRPANWAQVKAAHAATYYAELQKAQKQDGEQHIEGWIDDLSPFETLGSSWRQSHGVP